MKKIVIIVSLISLIFQSVFFSVSADDDSDLSKKTELMENMGIYLYDDEMEYTEDELSRELMARIFVYFYEKERDSEIKEYMGKTPFTDLDEGYWSAGEIMKLVEKGCMNGFSDGTFRAEECASYSQAIKAFVVILGYEEEAQVSGGWPNGYMSVADKLGLGNGVDLGINDKITKGDFTKILYNALDAEVSRIVIKSGEVMYEKGEILLNELGFFEIKGIMSATDKTSLLGEDIQAKDYIKIGDTVLKSSIGCSEYLGMRVEAYYKNTKDMDEAEIIYIKEYKNNIVTVQNENVDKASNAKTFVYYDSNKKKEIEISADTNFIFNERRLTYFSDNHIKPKSGSVTLIDADRDGLYETVKVKSYIEYIVSNVSLDGDKAYITDKNGKSPLIINLEEDDWSVSKNGEEYDIADIKKNAVLSVAADKMSGENLMIEDGAEYFDILVSESVTEGKASLYSPEDKQLVINEKTYKISNWFEFESYSLFTGVVGRFYLNSQKEISAVEYIREESYGFITRVFTDENDEESIFIKMFTQDDEFVTYKGADSLKIDGIHYKNAGAAIEQIKSSSEKFKIYTKSNFTNTNGSEQLVRFKLNADEELISVDTVDENYSNEAKEKECFQFSEYMAASNSNVLHCFKSARNIEGRIGLAKDLLTFEIPNDISDIDGYGMMPLSNYGDNISVPVCAFDMDEFNVAKVIMKCESSSEAVPSKELENMMLVEKKSIALNDNDESITVLSGVKIKNGQSCELILSERVKNADDIKKGDVVRWVAGNSGEAKVIQIASSADGNGDVLTKSSPYTSYYSDFRISYGTVYDISDEYMLVEYSNGIKEVYILSGVASLLECDVSGKGEISSGNYSSIKTAKDYGTDKATKVFTYQNYSLPKTIVIYK